MTSCSESDVCKWWVRIKSLPVAHFNADIDESRLGKLGVAWGLLKAMRLSWLFFAASALEVNVFCVCSLLRCCAALQGFLARSCTQSQPYEGLGKFQIWKSFKPFQSFLLKTEIALYPCRQIGCCPSPLQADYYHSYCVNCWKGPLRF